MKDKKDKKKKDGGRTVDLPPARTLTELWLSSQRPDFYRTPPQDLAGSDTKSVPDHPSDREST